VRRLLLDGLAPYRRQIVLVFGLLLVQSIANLYLPTLTGADRSGGPVRPAGVGATRSA
jgi:hypothetical protein